MLQLIKDEINIIKFGEKQKSRSTFLVKCGWFSYILTLVMCKCVISPPSWHHK